MWSNIITGQTSQRVFMSSKFTVRVISKQERQLISSKIGGQRKIYPSMFHFQTLIFGHGMCVHFLRGRGSFALSSHQQVASSVGSINRRAMVDKPIHLLSLVYFYFISSEMSAFVSECVCVCLMVRGWRECIKTLGTLVFRLSTYNWPVCGTLVHSPPPHGKV